MPQEGDSATRHFDDILRYVGEFGLWQKFLYFSSCFLVIVPSALQIASLVFATGTPKFNCVTTNVTCKESKCCEDCTSYAFDDSFTSTVTEVRHFVGRRRGPRRGLVNGVPIAPEALTKEPVLNIIIIIWLWVALRCFKVAMDMHLREDRRAAIISSRTCSSWRLLPLPPSSERSSHLYE